MKTAAESATLQQKLFEEFKTPSALRRSDELGYQYLETVFQRPPFPSTEAIRELDQFEEALPDFPGDATSIIEQLHSMGSPATVTGLGGRYFGFGVGSALPVGLAAKRMTTVWDQVPAMEVLSPVASRLESVVEGWLVDLLALPSETVAGFVSGSAVANLCALAAARRHQLLKQGWNVNEDGLAGSPKLRIVAGAEAHSTVMRALALLGFGKANIEWVPADEQGRLRADALPALDDRTIVILQAGHVNTGAFDPIRSVCEKARAAGAWVHIDGAFGLWARASAELAYLADGLELGDSWAVDAHKTLNVPYDSGIVLCKHRTDLTAALGMTGSYIVEGQHRDGMYYTPEMSRRARIFELWATLKYLGRQGVAELVTQLHHRAVQFKEEIAQQDGFDVLNEVVFNQVLVACSSDAITELTMKNIQSSAECWSGGAIQRGRRAIRTSIMSWATTEEDIHRAARAYARSLEKAKNQV